MTLIDKVDALISKYSYDPGDEYSPEHIIMSNSAYTDGDLDFDTGKNEELVAVLREVRDALKKGGQ